MSAAGPKRTSRPAQSVSAFEITAVTAQRSEPNRAPAPNGFSSLQSPDYNISPITMKFWNAEKPMTKYDTAKEMAQAIDVAISLARDAGVPTHQIADMLDEPTRSNKCF
jgi:hypothetical protein